MQLLNFINKIVFYLLLNILFYFFIYLNTNVYNCVNFRGLDEPFLKELCYKSIKFKCSKEIANDLAYTSINEFLKNTKSYNLNIVKYYNIINNKFIIFNDKSCYAHPNLSFGVYNNLHFNLQFSHNIYNQHFKEFTNHDLIGPERKQYLCTQLYIYNDYLYQQYLNHENLNLNQHDCYKNKYPIKIQNYLYNNKKGLCDTIKKIYN